MKRRMMLSYPTQLKTKSDVKMNVIGLQSRREVKTLKYKTTIFNVADTDNVSAETSAFFSASVT